jgi:dUTP pyrophosphatase
MDLSSTPLLIKKLNNDVKLPDRAHSTDAGMDVFSIEHAVIEPGGDYLFGLGWSCQLPPDTVMIVKEKSGRAVNDKLHVGAAVIDEGYRGEVHVHLFNAGKNRVIVSPGEKIAQVLVLPIWNGPVMLVGKLKETPRGEGGFGSTGI